MGATTFRSLTGSFGLDLRRVISVRSIDEVQRGSFRVGVGACRLIY